MSNNDNLLEQLIIYEDLTKERELLNKELLSLSGKNDTDSINRISEIEGLLNENNTKISSYDKDKLAKVEKYFASERDFRRLSNEIKAFENISKKGEEELVEVRSAEGRPKKIYKSLVEEYQKLTEQKASMRSSFLKEYKDIEKYTSIINEPTLSNTTPEIQEEVKNTKVQETEKTLPEAKNYKDMNNEEKQKYLEGRIQEIIASSKLPNMGKKSQVMYNGKRYNIPKAYRGQFLNLVGRLNALNKREAGKGNGENKDLENTIYDAKTIIMQQKPEQKETPKERVDRALDEIYGKDTIILPPKGNTEVQTNTQMVTKPAPVNNVAMNVKIEATDKQMAELINFCKEKGINLYPIKPANKKYKVVTKKALTTTKNKKALKRFKLQLPKAFNLDLYTKMTLLKMQNKLLDKGIKLQDRYINFKKGAIQKYNSVKNTVTSIPKRTSNYIKGKYNDFKKYFADKKEISRLRSEEGYTRKDAMAEVYGDKKNKHLDYRIVNRVVTFKENTCQKIETTTGKIVNTTKAVADTIAKPFRWLRDNYHNETKRAELLASKEEIQRQIAAKENAMRRVRTNPSAGGYVGTIAITIMGVLVLSGIIFMGIGSLINR